MEIFQEKVAVITGAASGLGRDLAFAAARLGMKLAIADIEQEALERTRQELAAQGAHVLAYHCDVRHAQAVQELADAVMQRFGSVHLLFNNAGVGCGGLVWENTEEDWEWVLGVNLRGAINGIRIFIPLMLECARSQSDYQGHVINTASMAGLVNAPALGAYNVSKHAVVALSESLYHDLNLVNAPIGASVLCPYFIATGINQSERNRPTGLLNATPTTASQDTARRLIDHAINSAKVSAAEVADLTFDAIKKQQFYIFTHPEALASVQERFNAMTRNDGPDNPYETMPEVMKMLKSGLS